MPQSPFRNRPQRNEDEVSWLHTDRTFSASYNVSATTHACSSRVWQGRAHANHAEGPAITASPVAAGSATADAAAGGLEPAEAAPTMSAAELTERSKLMFKLDASGPMASGRKALTPIVTKELVQLAWWAVNELCDEHGPALSQAYGNFDRVVALGWLLGDVRLGRLIEHEDAFKVGRKAAKRAPTLQANFDSPTRRVRKRKHASEEEWVAAAKEENTRRMAPVELPFPAEPAEPAEPADPSETPAQAAAREVRNRRHDLLSALRAAEGALMQADAFAAGAKRERERAKQAYENKKKWMENPRRQLQISDENWQIATKERTELAVRWRAANRVHMEAADALDGAKIDAWEAKENYKLFEEGVKRQEDLVRQERKERTNREEKWRQIELGLFLMNSRYAPDDPKRWEPDEWEYGELYDRWELDWEP